MNKENKPLVVGKLNNTLYQYNGDNSFTNLKTKVTGDIETDKAQSLFKIPLDLNLVVLKFPNVIKLMQLIGGNVKVESETGIKNYQI